MTFDRFADALEVLGGGAAAATDDVEETVLRPAADLAGHLLRRLVVLAERVGEPCVRVRRDTKGCPARQLGDVGARLIRSSAVEAHADRVRVREAIERAKASLVCPDSVRPEASVMVPEIMTGQRSLRR